jgi:hypothetical protein
MFFRTYIEAHYEVAMAPWKHIGGFNLFVESTRKKQNLRIGLHVSTKRAPSTESPPVSVLRKSVELGLQLR